MSNSGANRKFPRMLLGWATAVALTLLAVQAYAGPTAGSATSPGGGPTVDPPLPINSPVPSNAYIIYDGLEWAWGGPCPYSGGCYATGTLAYQGTQGWSLPSAADMAIVNSLDGSVYGGCFSVSSCTGKQTTFADLFLDHPGGNVPPNGTDPVSGAYFAQGTPFPTVDGSCASPYFDTAAAWCDSIDGVNGLWAGSAIGNNSGYGYYAEQLYVRAVPEPASLSLLGAALIALGAARRRKRG